MAGAAPVNDLSVRDQLGRGNVLSANCPSRLVLNHLTSRWGVLVLIALLSGTQRFSDLRRKVGGVSERMLSQTLKSLESDGMVERHSHPVVPPHVEYTLTDLGIGAANGVLSLTEYVEDNLPRIKTIWAKSGSAVP